MSTETTSYPTATVLLTGGRAPATLELARLFHLNKCRVLIAESQVHHLSRASRAVAACFSVRAPRHDPDGFIQDLLAIIKNENVDCLIPTCEEVFYVARGKSILSEQCRVWVDDIDKLTRLHNKWEFIQLASELGCRVPHTDYVTESKTLIKILSQLRPIVAKPVYSRFASKAIILEATNAPTPKSISVTPESPWVVQEFIRGQEVCTYSVAQDGRLLAHSTYCHEFTAGRGAGISFESIEHPALFEWVSEFVKKLNFTGQIAFDFIIPSSGEIYPLECNPRATSGVHLFVDQASFAELFLGRSSGVCVPAKDAGALLALPMFLQALPSIRGFSKLKRFLTALCCTRDVVFRLQDPLPALYQFVCVYQLLRTSLKRNVSLLEASTEDIEFNGAP